MFLERLAQFLTLAIPDTIRGKWRVTTSLYFIGKKRLIPEETYKSSRKLNLGSGNTPLPTYINVDILTERHPDVSCKVYQLPFTNETFDLVRSSHILEHFEYSKANEVISEWIRVLRPGGYLILCVPDMVFQGMSMLFFSKYYNPMHAKYKPWSVIGYFALGLPPEFRHQALYSHKSLRDLINSFKELRIIGEMNFLLEEPYILGKDDNSHNLGIINFVCHKISVSIEKTQETS